MIVGDSYLMSHLQCRIRIYGLHYIPVHYIYYELGKGVHLPSELTFRQRLDMLKENVAPGGRLLMGYFDPKTAEKDLAEGRMINHKDNHTGPPTPPPLECGHPGANC